MNGILSNIQSPDDLKRLSANDLDQLAGEMRETLCRLLGTRSAHFASNLGVIELTLALHTTFDFRRDRLIWDTGHQVYAHKMVTGRYDEFPTIRSKGGLMGYPNPAESPYDLFMTGHAGASVATALGLKCGDDLVRRDEKRHVVAVIGDGAFSSGLVLEAMDNTGGLKKQLTVVLNDNKMSICPRVGGLAEYLDRLRMAPFYTGLKAEVQKLLNRVPVLGDPVERFLDQTKDALKAGMLGGMLFEELGFRYIGPVDGHNIRQLQKYLAMVRDFQGPVLLHVVTEKGHGFEPAVEDPTSFHAPAPFLHENGEAVSLKKDSPPPYTEVARDAILDAMRDDSRVVVITAAMCQGNMLEPVREEFPERFFDVGICESHAVAFAAGLAKAGLRPIVDVYSTFMQRAYDQIFQEVALQNLSVTLMLDRAGLVGPDGPTHHGVFDLTYLRPFPNLVVMAPGDALDVPLMLRFALAADGPMAIRYPKASAESIDRRPAPVELGIAETLRFGHDGTILACGTMFVASVRAADRLRKEGLELGVINARFVKPLDTETILRAVDESPLVVTVEEGALMGGFGSAVLEAVSEAGLSAGRIRRLGVPDFFVEHGDRAELLADLGLDEHGIARACRQLAGRPELMEGADHRRVG
ncbi:MAG: 1-deoxy-D-xylulose-5-phosphate synthase [Planctomycetes bacterium RBG_16_64_12]|nr:MAG: 1-deoxy-D-xylulose-5-phosphate synthase [Planctomycetes bacterium RBG_16_64_12]